MLPFSQVVNLSAFGAPTLKPIDVCSDCVEVRMLAKPTTRTGLKQLTYVDKNGSVAGKKDQLSRSQAYPAKFGRRVAIVYKHILKKRAVEKALPSWVAELDL